jgi:regulatory protein
MAESTLYITLLSKTMALCSRRELCVSDIQAKLESWGLGMAESEKIIQRLIKENFINEERYASAFAKDKFRYNKWGKIKIGFQLKSKKIPATVIKEALDTIDDDTYISVLKDLIKNHKRGVKARNDYEMKSKLLRFGLSRGFESSLLYNLLDESE